MTLDNVGSFYGEKSSNVYEFVLVGPVWGWLEFVLLPGAGIGVSV